MGAGGEARLEGDPPGVAAHHLGDDHTVVRQGLRLAGLGVAAGIVSALFVTRAMGSLLFETPATDPWIYLGIAGLLTSTAALACWVPARRAASVDPLVALRS